MPPYSREEMVKKVSDIEKRINTAKETIAVLKAKEEDLKEELAKRGIKAKNLFEKEKEFRKKATKMREEINTILDDIEEKLTNMEERIRDA